MSLRSRKPAGQPAIVDQEDVPIPKPYKRRWRLALTAIYFTRALASLAKKLLHGNNSQLLRSRSYVAIDVPRNQDDHDNARWQVPRLRAPAFSNTEKY
ncbi:hypothetical protein C1H46_021440 [Malus baccata]|uniref:Uncharacterized protein n=1 Tax=Malus baccata TaxID=106549 RepID=A0A540M2J3_MALBA|nr:hypothetical protein C1H46_021440 [Malus baccata]